jgi:biotin operon repressor
MSPAPGCGVPLGGGNRRAPRFVLSDLQRRIVALVGEGDWIATEDLMANVGVSRQEFAAAVTELSEHGLMTERVASLGSGWWNLTPTGRALSEAAADEG